MRIGQMVQSYQLQAQTQQQTQQPQSDAASASARNAAGVDKASRSNQARLSEAAKGFVQASRVRDGVATVASSLGQAAKLVAKAQGTNVSATDRKQLQTDFAKALAAVDQGVKDQRSAKDDSALANTAFQAKAVTVSAADQLGTGVSKQFASLAELKKLDLSTASSEQLAEAAKVLDAARSESNATLAAADAQDGRLSGRVAKFQGVKDALAGSATLSSRQHSTLEAIRSLGQQSSGLTPGSIYNSFG